MSKDGRLGVMPIITVDSVDEIHRFYTEKLGFQHVMGVVGKDGGLDFVTVVRSGVRIMFSRAQEKIAGAGVNIEHCYSTAMGKGKATFVIRASDNGRAKAAIG